MWAAPSAPDASLLGGYDAGHELRTPVLLNNKIDYTASVRAAAGLPPLAVEPSAPPAEEGKVDAEVVVDSETLAPWLHVAGRGYLLCKAKRSQPEVGELPPMSLHHTAVKGIAGGHGDQALSCLPVDTWRNRNLGGGVLRLAVAEQRYVSACSSPLSFHVPYDPAADPNLENPEEPVQVDALKQGGVMLTKGGVVCVTGKGSLINSSVWAGRVKISYVSCGHSHILGISRQGARVYAWGSNNKGQLGVVTEEALVKEPQLVETITSPVQHVAAGTGHSLAVTREGKLYAWGWNSSGQLGLGHCNDEALPAKVVLEDVKQVAAGAGHSLALTTAGDVFAWGCNADSQLGLGGDEMVEDYLSSMPGIGRAIGGATQNTPAAVATLVRHTVTQIVAGAYHSAALTSLGKVYTWGRGSDGQLGFDQALCSTPTLVRTLDSQFVGAISAGSLFTGAVVPARPAIDILSESLTLDMIGLAPRVNAPPPPYADIEVVGTDGSVKAHRVVMLARVMGEVSSSGTLGSVALITRAKDTTGSLQDEFDRFMMHTSPITKSYAALQEMVQEVDGKAMAAALGRLQFRDAWVAAHGDYTTLDEDEVHAVMTKALEISKNMAELGQETPGLTCVLAAKQDEGNMDETVARVMQWAEGGLASVYRRVMRRLSSYNNTVASTAVSLKGFLSSTAQFIEDALASLPGAVTSQRHPQQVVAELLGKGQAKLPAKVTAAAGELASLADDLRAVLASFAELFEVMGSNWGISPSRVELSDPLPLATWVTTIKGLEEMRRRIEQADASYEVVRQYMQDSTPSEGDSKAEHSDVGSGAGVGAGAGADEDESKGDASSDVKAVDAGECGEDEVSKGAGEVEDVEDSGDAGEGSGQGKGDPKKGSSSSAEPPASIYVDCSVIAIEGMLSFMYSGTVPYCTKMYFETLRDASRKLGLWSLFNACTRWLDDGTLFRADASAPDGEGEVGVTSFDNGKRVRLARCAKVSIDLAAIAHTPALDAFADARLVGSDGEVAAHTCMLFFRCQAFLPFLKPLRGDAAGEDGSIGDGKVTMTAYNTATLTRLITYLYSGIIGDTGTMSEQVVALLAIAARFNLPRLTTLCEAQVDTYLTDDNVVELFDTAATFNAAQLQAMCRYYTCVHYSTVSRTAAFKALARDHPLRSAERKEEVVAPSRKGNDGCCIM